MMKLSDVASITRDITFPIAAGFSVTLLYDVMALPGKNPNSTIRGIAAIVAILVLIAWIAHTIAKHTAYNQFYKTLEDAEKQLLTAKVAKGMNLTEEQKQRMKEPGRILVTSRFSEETHPSEHASTATREANPSDNESRE